MSRMAISGSILASTPRFSTKRSTSTREAVSRVKENVQMLVAFTNAVQQHCGISSRLLWSESGESLAQKLVDRLQRVN